MRLRADRIKWLVLLTPLVALLCGGSVASAARGAMLRTVSYHGYSVTVPRSWPVFNLANAPHTCVRFNRHALYLGVPGNEQRCPAQAIGRTEAILIEPTGASIARARPDHASLTAGGSATTFIVRSAGVDVTATWHTDPQLMARALHRRTLPKVRTARLQPRLEPRGSGGGAPAPAAAPFYTGPGFDTCDAPSAQQMLAWTSYSPYHAIGVYIGGTNAACPPGPGNPNLTSAWLSSEAAAGWHFIPTYVGLQAPSNSCGCTAIKSTQASAEGTAAADDAVAQAQSLDLGSGTPIYDDMEYYSRTTTNSSAVLAFLAAWTTELHAKGYLSGVYGNADSAIADLVTQAGTSYPEPDDIWFAAWPGDGSQSTSDPNIPGTDWSNHERLHQFSGGHDETYGGVTLNIDGDYLDGATAGSLSSLPPMLSVAPSASGLTNLTASWGGLGLARWEVLAGTNAAAMTNIRSAPLEGAQTQITVRSDAPYFAIEALGSSGELLASSAPVASPARLALFGHSSFVGEQSEVGTVPVGCFLATACHIVATIYWGHTRLARTVPQTFRSGGSGIVYYRLNWAGLRLLAKLHDAKTLVKVTITDATGTSQTARMSLIPFATSGRSPARSLTPGPAVGAVGTTEFVHGWSGGILTRCSTPGACWITAKLKSGNTTIASARPQLVGGLELGYVFFSLTTRGRQVLKQTAGKQLGVTLSLRSGTSVATGRLALVQF